MSSSRSRAPALALVVAQGLALAACAAFSASAADDAGTPARGSLLSALQRAAPDADPQVIALALEARDCALQADPPATSPLRMAAGAERLAVIDYSRPSTEPRLWVFDLARARLLYSEHVAHGRGSGENYATAFSNVDSSHRSSLGLFATAETYIGGNGYSLRMDGLEPGVNDRARDRAIVMHGAPYVDPLQALRQGRLGRSLGCPALRPAVAQQLIDTLKHGQLLFAYYPDREWLATSRFLRCKSNLGMDANDSTQRSASPAAARSPADRPTAR